MLCKAFTQIALKIRHKWVIFDLCMPCKKFTQPDNRVPFLLPKG